MYRYIYVCMYTYIHVYIYIYMYIHSWGYRDSVGGYIGVIKGSYSVWDLGYRILRGLRFWAQGFGYLTGSESGIR